jgi:hypothetical protein
LNCSPYVVLSSLSASEASLYGPRRSSAKGKLIVLRRYPQPIRVSLEHFRRRWPFLPLRLRPLAAAGLCAAGLGLTWVVAALVPASQVRDAAALDGFTHLIHLRALAYHIAELVDP